MVAVVASVAWDTGADLAITASVVSAGMASTRGSMAAMAWAMAATAWAMAATATVIRTTGVMGPAMAIPSTALAMVTAMARLTTTPGSWRRLWAWTIKSRMMSGFSSKQSLT